MKDPMEDFVFRFMLIVTIGFSILFFTNSPNIPVRHPARNKVVSN